MLQHSVYVYVCMCERLLCFDSWTEIRGGKKDNTPEFQELGSGVGLNVSWRKDVLERAGGGSGARGQPVDRRQHRDTKFLHRQSLVDGVSGLLWQSRALPLSRVSDRIPGVQYQLGAALHVNGHLVEEESPVERRPDRNRHQLRGQ